MVMLHTYLLNTQDSIHKTIIYLLIVSLSSCQNPQEIKKEQYLVAGKTLYQAHCANCHQADGKGLANLYPPIDAQYLKDTKSVARLIRFGSIQSVSIKGKHYTQKMPANTELKNLDIAQILTYINNEWGENKEIVEVESIEK